MKKSSTRLLVAALGLMSIPLLAGAQNKQQVLMLPNPTPREPDLERKYGTDTTSGVAAQHGSVLLNQKRQALVAKASAQLASLAEVLKKAMALHKSGTSLAPEEQVAGLIEQLATNVTAALEAGGPAPAPSKSTADASADLQADIDRLAALTEDLKTEVARTNADTLSLDVLVKSNEVARLAKSLKQRMKRDSAG